MKLFGAHISSDLNNFIDDMNLIKRYGGNIVQCFVDIHKNYNDYKEIKYKLEKSKMKLIVHASYTINIAQDWTEYSWWIKQFLREIEISEYLGAYGIVIHLGKQLKLSKQEGLNNMFTSLIYIYNQIKNYKIKIFFETSTGQGSEMCYELNDFAYFFNKFLKIDKEKFRICLDTCHIYQAGYDISKIENIKNYLKQFDNLIGLRYIGLIHFNDSKNPLGSKLDRHENLGLGYIGKENLLFISKFFLKNNVPLILETKDSSKYEEEIRDYFVQINNS